MDIWQLWYIYHFCNIIHKNKNGPKWLPYGTPDIELKAVEHTTPCLHSVQKVITVANSCRQRQLYVYCIQTMFVANDWYKEQIRTESLD